MAHDQRSNVTISMGALLWSDGVFADASAFSAAGLAGRGKLHFNRPFLRVLPAAST